MAKKQNPQSTVSKTSQMKTFAASHKGEQFTATGLARALGWVKQKIKKVKGEDGKSVENVKVIGHYTKAAVRIAKKYAGAKVTKTVPPKSDKEHLVPIFTIVL